MRLWQAFIGADSRLIRPHADMAHTMNPYNLLALSYEHNLAWQHSLESCGSTDGTTSQLPAPVPVSALADPKYLLFGYHTYQAVIVQS